MKNPKNILITVLTALSVLTTVLLVGSFDGVLNRIGAWCGFSEATEYQNGAFLLAILCYLSCAAVALLVPTVLTKLQYKITYPAALSFAVGKYGFGFITLPLFIMRFVSVKAWLPYITNEAQIANPLYHETLF